MILPVTGRKGGIGKTTSTKELAYAFARARELSVDWDRDYRTLVVDMDAQGNLSASLNRFPGAGDLTVANVLLDGADIRSAIQETDTPNLHVLPANDELEFGIHHLQGVDGAGSYLRQVLGEVQDDYDIVLIDCPPSVGLQWQLSMQAGDAYLMPVETTHFGVQGLNRMFDVIRTRTATWNLAPLLGIALVRVDLRDMAAREIVSTLRNEPSLQHPTLGPLLFGTAIRKNTALDWAHQMQQSIFDYNPRASGAQDYRGLARQVLERAGQWGLLPLAVEKAA